MTKEKVAIKDLQVGMYIELPASWLSHNFLKNKFKITSEKLLDEIKKQNLKQVIVDYNRSDFPTKPVVNPSSIQQHEPTIKKETLLKDPKENAPPKKWDSEKLLTDDLRNVLDDQKLPPEKKSAIIYEHSINMMEQLLEFPSAENISSSKQAIYAISDMVMAEDDTAQNMLKITTHDFYTYTHSVNVGITSILLSKQLFKHSDAHDLQELAAGFFLHDLGKINIDPEVLNKPGKLDDIEMRHIRTHPYQGYKILQQADALSEECKIIVMQHHEATDGSGYPKRLKDQDIHLYGRICAIADVFDALTAERSYKKAMKPFDALRLMKEQMIDRFDQKIFGEFVKIFLAA